MIHEYGVHFVVSNSLCCLPYF
jgi:histidinol dehydrogenase